jgi:mRNA interferase HigB
MRVIAIKRLREYWQKQPACEQALRAWYAEAENADWKTPADIKATYRNASILKNGRVVFNICGNNH